MVATCEIWSYHGEHGSQHTNISRDGYVMRFKQPINEQDVAAADTDDHHDKDHPLLIPASGYSHSLLKHIKLVFITQPDNRITNLQFVCSESFTDRKYQIFAAVSKYYRSPIYNNNPIGHHAEIITTGAEKLIPINSGIVLRKEDFHPHEQHCSGNQDYVRLQIRVAEGASSGLIGQIQLAYRYDED